MAGLASAAEGVEGGRTLSHTGLQVQVAHQAHTLVIDQLGSDRAGPDTLSVEWGFILVEALHALSETPAAGTASTTEGTGGSCSIVELTGITTLHTPAIDLEQLTPTKIAQIHGSTTAVATSITLQAGEASVQVVQRTLSDTVTVEGLEAIGAPQTVGGSSRASGTFGIAFLTLPSYRILSWRTLRPTLVFDEHSRTLSETVVVEEELTASTASATSRSASALCTSGVTDQTTAVAEEGPGRTLLQTLSVEVDSVLMQLSHSVSEVQVAQGATHR